MASVGLYALTAYSVAQRTREVGVRMALGAEPSSVVWLFLRRSVVHIAIGLILGLAGAIGMGQVLRSVINDVGTRDPVTFLAVAVTLVVVTLTASLLPARRATRIDPVVALRSE
jgi:putative ABC transport system permease protein